MLFFYVIKMAQTTLSIYVRVLRSISYLHISRKQARTSGFEPSTSWVSSERSTDCATAKFLIICVCMITNCIQVYKLFLTKDSEFFGYILYILIFLDILRIFGDTAWEFLAHQNIFWSFFEQILIFLSVSLVNVEKLCNVFAYFWSFFKSLIRFLAR